MRRAWRNGFAVVVILALGIGVWWLLRPKSIVLRARWQVDGEVTNLAFAPKGNLLAASVFPFSKGPKSPMSISLWSISERRKTGQAFYRDDFTFAPLPLIAFSPDGHLLALSIAKGERGQILFLRVPDGHRQTLPIGRATDIIALSFSPDGRQLAVASFVATPKPSWHLSLHEVTQQKRLWAQAQGLQAISALAFSPDGQHLAIAHRRDLIDILNASDRHHLRRIQLPKKAGRIESLRFTPDGSRMLVVTRQSNTLTVWQVTREKVAMLATLPAISPLFVSSRPFDHAFSPDGQILAFAKPHPAGLAWWMRRVEHRITQAERLPTSPPEPPTKIALWQLSTKRLIAQLPHLGYGATAVAFSPDGRFLASASFGISLDGALRSTIDLWEITPTK
jgi:WD40 repeat protein